MNDNTALTQRGSTAIATGKDVPRGFENQTHEDYMIPFLLVMQDLSPMVKQGDADVGDFGNSVTEESFAGPEGVVVVPALTDHVFVEWKPNRGGFVGIRRLDDPEVVKARSTQDFGEYKSEAGNDLVETFYVYAAMKNPDDTIEHVVIPFTSMKIKKYKQWMYKARQLRVPLDPKKPDGPKRPAEIYEHAWRIFTREERNEKGDFFNVKVVMEGGILPETDELYQSAKSCYEAVMLGQAKADYESLDNQEGSGMDEAITNEADREF